MPGSKASSPFGTSRKDGQGAGDLIEGGPVDGDDLGGERGQVARRPRAQAARQQVADGGKDGLQRPGILLGQAFVDGLVGEGKAGIVPEATGGQQPPDRALAGHAAQDANEDAAPQSEGRQDAGTTGPRTAGLGGIGFEIAQDPLDDGFDLIEQRLALLGIERIGDGGGDDTGTSC